MQASGFCTCLDEQCGSDQFDVTPVSTQRNDGMVNRMEVFTCQECGRHWIHYSTDHEARAGWGRWYRGLMESGPEEVTEEEGYRVLESLPWHFYGGTYYRTAGEKSMGPVRLRMQETWLQAA